VALLSTGTLLFNTLKAAAQLTEQGTAVDVYHFGTIKPLDTAALDAIAAQCERIVTVEEHQVAGGFGSAVAEYVAETNPTRVVRVGVRDQYGQSGTPEELITHYGMDIGSIIKAATE
jgi:transketolase